MASTSLEIRFDSFLLSAPLSFLGFLGLLFRLTSPNMIQQRTSFGLKTISSISYRLQELTVSKKGTGNWECKLYIVSLTIKFDWTLQELKTELGKKRQNLWMFELHTVYFLRRCTQSFSNKTVFLRSVKLFIMWMFNMTTSQLLLPFSNNLDYYTLNSITHFWLAKSVQWILQIMQ